MFIDYSRILFKAKRLDELLALHSLLRTAF